MILIEKAITALEKGDVIGLPTETVYGLAADASNEVAVRKIFSIKRRPLNHPLIVHIGEVSQLTNWAREIPSAAFKLAEAFWPGPLTLILKKNPTVLDIITGNQDTIGIRIPNHPVTLQLLKILKKGIAAPSANRFGRISPTSSQHVREELGDQVELILEGGQCQIGVESTILDLSNNLPVILRPGMITQNQIEKILGCSLSTSPNQSIRVSGNLNSHYAPKTPTILVSSEKLTHYLSSLSDKDFPIIVGTQQSLLLQDGIAIKKLPNSPEKYAQILYQTLREFDQKNYNKIIMELTPNEPEWRAITDRLLKAACERIF